MQGVFSFIRPFITSIRLFIYTRCVKQQSWRGRDLIRGGGGGGGRGGGNWYRPNTFGHDCGMDLWLFDLVSQLPSFRLPGLR